MTEQLKRTGVPRGWRAWQPATRVALISLLLGVGAAVGALATWATVDQGRLLLVAGVLDGETLSMLLWCTSCLSIVVLGVAGFRLFVIGYEAVTAAMAAIFLCALVLAACLGALVASLFALLASEGSFVTLHELDRPLGSQIVIEDTRSSYGPAWRFHVGGPFLFDEIEDSTMTTAECTTFGPAGRTTFADGEYRLTTDEHGQDVVTFTTDKLRDCSHGGATRLVLPD